MKEAPRLMPEPSPSKESPTPPRWVKWALVTLVLASALLRVPGLFYGFPEIVMRDELTYAGVALEMLQQGTLDPKEYRHGNFIHYFYLVVFSVIYYPARWLSLYPSAEAAPEWHFYLVARVLSLLCSLGSLLLLFRIGTRLFNPRAGLWASALLAFQPSFFRYGQLAKLDIYVLLLSLMAAHLFLNLYERGGRRQFRLAGVLMGVGVAAKYSMVAFGPSLLILFWLVRSRVAAGTVPSRQASWRFVIEALGIALLLGLLLNLFVFLNWEEALQHINRQYRITVQGQHLMASQLEGLDPWNVLTGHLPRALGWPLGLLAVAGWIYWCWQDWRRCLIVSLYPVFHYALVCRWRFAFPRELLPVFPPLCLGAALALEQLHQWSRQFEKGYFRLAPLFLIAVCLVSLITPVASIYQKQHRILKGNTRILAKRWVETHIPRSARIAHDSFVLPVRETHPDVVFAHTLGLHPYEFYVEQEVEYLLKSRLGAAVQRSQPRVAAHDRDIESRAQLLAAWNAADLGIEGPNLAVYRVPENAPVATPPPPQKTLDSPRDR